MIDKKELENALEILHKDPIRNISFINFIHNYSPTYLKVFNDSLLAKGISDHEWVYICCDNGNDLEKLISFVPDAQYFAVLEEWMVPIVLHNRSLVSELKTRRYYLPDNVKLTESHDVSPLSVNDAEFIYENSKYKDYLSVEYVKDRIINGPSSGIRNGNYLAAWAMTQDDGALGFLHVMDEYRRKGLAQKIMTQMILQIREQNKMPFSYIEDTNQNAINLVTKFGFKSDRLISWITVK